jgi:hypothetical protein
VGPRVVLDGCGKFCPLTRIRSPDRPARSESLYRLSFPGPGIEDYKTYLIEVRSNITCSTTCKYITAATLHTLVTWFVSGI